MQAVCAPPTRSWPNAVARPLLGIVAVAALLLGLSLWLGAARTKDFFAWTIASPTAASALGGFYIGIGIYAAAAAACRSWSVRRPVFPPAIAGPLLLLIPTTIHRDLFNFRHVLAWLWLIDYIVFPLALLVVYVAGLLAYPDTGSEPKDVPRWQRASLLLLSVIVAAAGFVLLVWPTALAGEWPWPLTPLMSQVYGCWLIAAAVGLTAIGLERTFAFMHLGLWAILAVSASAVIAPFLHPGELRMGFGIIFWLAFISTPALLSGGLLWIHKT